MYVFVSLGYIPKSGISGLYDNSTFNLLRTSQTIFQSDCTTLHCHQQCLRVLITPHPCQHLLLSFGWIHLSEWKWYLFVDEEWHWPSFYALIAICISSLEKCLFKPFSVFKIFLSFWPYLAAYGVFIPQPGDKSVFPTVEA